MLRLSDVCRRGTSPGPGERRGRSSTPAGVHSSAVRHMNESLESSASNFDAFLQRQEDFIRKQDMNIQLRCVSCSLRDESAHVCVMQFARRIRFLACLTTTSSISLRTRRKDLAALYRPLLVRLESPFHRRMAFCTHGRMQMPFTGHSWSVCVTFRANKQFFSGVLKSTRMPSPT